MLSRGSRLLPDNAPAQLISSCIVESRACGFGILQHPPYSPDHAPNDFFIFPEMKNPLLIRRFDNTDDVINEVEEWFQAQSADFYNNGIPTVKRRWKKCVNLDGDYVEKS